MTASRVKLSPSFWMHDSSVPLSSDISPESLFLTNKDFLVVDIETKTLVDAVGGWKNFKQLEVSVACAYDSKTKQMHSYLEKDLKDLIELCKERLVIGYNILGFDLPVLEKYGLSPGDLNTFDLMQDIQNISGWRFLKLEKVATATLGTGKSADGVMAVEWWKEGKIDQIIEYCKKDVEVTRDVFLHGLNHGHVKIEKADGSHVEVKVNWS